MSDENRMVEEHHHEHKCFCESKGFRKFLTVALGTFVGVFCALSLFAALHKPPMMHPMSYGAPMMGPCQCGCRHFNRGHHFDRGGRCDRSDFHKKIVKQHCDKKFPPRAQEIDD